jgi:thiosulfate/3-mercaptopyruvate sulfurtransferase
MRPLIAAAGLAGLLESRDGDLAVVDCRYDLGDHEAGRRAYLASHIPGAVYAHVREDLAGPPLTDRGRHPLPSPGALVATFSRLGIGPATRVAVYDDSGGSFAGRLWWLLHYMGHQDVQLLDGGWRAWTSGDFPVRAGSEARAPAAFSGAPRPGMVIYAPDVTAARLLLDARDAERYRGDVEPLDKRAGHIPGALNRPWKDNLAPDGTFRPAAELRAGFTALIGGAPPADVVCYCGSGVTACHNVIAMCHAGFPMPTLYAGSWSDWISDASRPAATGPGP